MVRKRPNLTREHIKLFIWVVLIFELMVFCLAVAAGRHSGYGYAFAVCFWLGLVVAVVFLCIFLLNLAGILTLSMFNRRRTSLSDAHHYRTTMINSYDFPVIKNILRHADHVDVKTVEGPASLSGFIAAMLSYRPSWLRFFYSIRKPFVAILGMRQVEDPEMLKPLKAAEVPFKPGERASFFIVRHAAKDCYWIAETPEEKHLRAFICIFRKEIHQQTSRFDVMTVVHYKHWIGPVYFNMIRPFHHLVVKQMALAGVRKGECP